MNADGSGQRQVTQDAIHVWGSSWSPDGLRLAFASCVQGNPGNFNIYVVNVDGSGQQQLTHDPGPDQRSRLVTRRADDRFPELSHERPLGGRRWQKVLYVMNADGSGSGS